MGSPLRFDSAYLVLYGYPALFWLGFWLSPDVTGVLWLAGCVIAIPLFLLQGRGEPADPGSEKHGVSWFRFVLAGLVFNWPFIVATLAAWWRRRRKRQERER